MGVGGELWEILGEREERRASERNNLYDSHLVVVHLVFLTYLEQNFEELCKTTKFKNIFTTRKLKLVAKLESETDSKKIYEIFFLKKNSY